MTEQLNNKIILDLKISLLTSCPLRQLILKKIKNKITSVGEDVEKSEPCACLVTCKIVQPLWRTE